VILVGRWMTPDWQGGRGAFLRTACGSRRSCSASTRLLAWGADCLSRSDNARLGLERGRLATALNWKDACAAFYGDVTTTRRHDISCSGGITVVRSLSKIGRTIPMAAFLLAWRVVAY